MSDVEAISPELDVLREATRTYAGATADACAAVDEFATIVRRPEVARAIAIGEQLEDARALTVATAALRERERTRVPRFDSGVLWRWFAGPERCIGGARLVLAKYPMELDRQRVRA